MNIHGRKPNTLEHFWNKVDKTSNPKGCWEYTGPKDRDGYGRFNFNHKIWPTHRLSASLAGHDIENKIVCHHCDNTSCVNPSHLFVGTIQDNNLDKFKKKRQSKKLTEDQIRQIRGDQDRYCDMVRKYKIDQSTIRKIKNFVIHKEII
jgi:sporulation protein YlmC with PRC-barrel domain